MPEVKINKKEYPMTLRVKIFDKVYNALTNLCKSNGAWFGCTVKASSISENNVFIKIIDPDSSMAWCAFQISENPEHISIRVLDYNSETDKPSVLPDHDMEIAKIFTNKDPIRGEMITLDKCADLSGKALWAVRSITNAFDIARQRTPELNIAWYKLGESDNTEENGFAELTDDTLKHIFELAEKAVWHDLVTPTSENNMDLVEEKEIIKRNYGPQQNMRRSYTVTIDDQYRHPHKYDIDISLAYKPENPWDTFQISFFSTPEGQMRWWQSSITILPTTTLVKIVRHRRFVNLDSRSFIVMGRIFKTLRDKLIEEYGEYNVCVEDDTIAALKKIPGEENIEYPTSATLRFDKSDLPVQRCPNMLCEFDMMVTEVQDDVIKCRCPKCGIRFSRTLDNVIKDIQFSRTLEDAIKDTDKDIPSYHVELPNNVKATQLWPNLTWDHVIMPSHRAENNKEENEMKENKKCVIERERLISIIQTFLNNTSEHRPWKNKPGTLKTGEIVWSGTKQRGMYFPLIGITAIGDSFDDSLGFEIWNTTDGDRDNINIRIDHEGIKFIENSNFNDFGYEFIHDLYEFINDNMDETKIKNQIKNVIFSNPATTVLWKDGTKTTVQTQVLEYTTTTKPDGTVVKKPKKRVPFDPEAALAACIMNKLFGSHSAYAKYVNGYVVKSEAKKAKTKKKVKKEKEPTPPKKPTKKPSTKARKVTIEGGKK